MEHGFPHQPSALSYSPTLQLLAIGTRSGAIKLYPSLYLSVSSCQRGIWAACLNLRQAAVISSRDAAKSASEVHMSTWFRYFIFPHCCSIQPGIFRCQGLWHFIGFFWIMLIDHAAEPVCTLSPLTQRHTLVLLTTVPSLNRIIHSYSAAHCSGTGQQEGTDQRSLMNIVSQSAECFRPRQRTAASVVFMWHTSHLIMWHFSQFPQGHCCFSTVRSGSDTRLQPWSCRSGNN